MCIKVHVFVEYTALDICDTLRAGHWPTVYGTALLFVCYTREHAMFHLQTVGMHLAWMLRIYSRNAYKPSGTHAADH